MTKDSNIIKLQITGHFMPSNIQLNDTEIEHEMEILAQLPIGKTTFDKAMQCLKKEGVNILTDGRNFYAPATSGTKLKRKVLLIVSHKKLTI